jgi:glycosyl hydrolase family 99
MFRSTRPRRLSRRRFMAAALAAAPAAIAARLPAAGAAWPAWDRPGRRSLGFPVPEERWHGDSSVGAAARTDPRLFRDERERPRRPPPEPRPPSPSPSPSEWQRFGAQLAVFRDLRRHFIFEYYPWYQAGPWRHWEEAGRNPPIDLAAFAVPALGAYDSRDAAVLEQHARWLAEAGAGAVNLSWWGPGSAEDRAVPLIMDVMRAHDIHVTFHLEPYADNRATRLADDLLYLVREYGERRRWDAFLLLEDERGTARPVFKLFRTILEPTTTDCRGRIFPVPDYTEDGMWRRQIDAVRTMLRADFEPIVLSDSLGAGRTAAGGFDGMAVYDPYVRPASWPSVASTFSSARLLFSFNVNAGFDHYTERPPFGECFTPSRFEPPIDATGWDAAARAEALAASRDRILDSLRTTLTLQLDPALADARRGFFLTYINSFNEWHEGTAFEPAADLADLSPAQRAIGYHNPDNGRWRLQLLQALLRELVSPGASPA